MDSVTIEALKILAEPVLGITVKAAIKEIQQRIKNSKEQVPDYIKKKLIQKPTLEDIIHMIY